MDCRCRQGYRSASVMRSRIPLFTLMRVQIGLLTLMRIGSSVISDVNLRPQEVQTPTVPFWAYTSPLWASAGLPFCESSFHSNTDIHNSDNTHPTSRNNADPNPDLHVTLGVISLSGVADPDPVHFDHLDPGSGMGKNSRSGCGMNIPVHISESLETFFVSSRIRNTDYITSAKEVLETLVNSHLDKEGLPTVKISAGCVGAPTPVFSSSLHITLSLT